MVRDDAKKIRVATGGDDNGSALRGSRRGAHAQQLGQAAMSRGHDDESMALEGV